MTLLFGTRETGRNNAVVLREYLQEQMTHDKERKAGKDERAAAAAEEDEDAPEDVPTPRKREHKRSSVHRDDGEEAPADGRKRKRA